MRIFGIEVRDGPWARTRGQHHNPENPVWPMSGFGRNDAQGMYRKFHYKNPKKKRDIDIPDSPSAAFVIGRLVNLTYLPYGSSGKPHELHIHKFGDDGYRQNKNPLDMPLLLGSRENGKDSLYIARDHSKYYLNARGIVD